MSDPGNEYETRRRVRLERIARAETIERRVAYARLVIFVAGVFTAWQSVVSQHISPAWIVPPVLAFVALVIVHSRTIRDRQLAERAAAFYERGQARLSGTWMGRGRDGSGFLEPGHPYAADLDLFGSGSLFEFLCAARTAAGEDALARLLIEPIGASAPAAGIAARQAAIAELRPRLDLREDLAILGEEVRARMHPERLVAWGEAPGVMPGIVIRGIVCVASTLVVAGLVAWLILGRSALPFSIALVLAMIVLTAVRSRVGRVVADVELPASELLLLGAVTRRLEAETFESPLLSRLRGSLQTAGASPTRAIPRLGRLTELLDSTRNLMFAPLAIPVLWPVHLAFAIDRWRLSHGPRIAGWLSVVGELEALSSIAGYAYEHPDDPFPEVTTSDGPLFDAEALGHPLIPDARCVRNDLRLAGEPALLVVSGSNMSGKSTLLRAVGVNTVLAMMGAPVRARRLRLSPLVPGASIRTQDSLQEGTSRFYAEITHLRRLMDVAGGEPPLLFLIDEILQGTNSHDRRIGAEALLRGLLDRGAIGLATTHDLALASIADALAPRAGNVHFEDRIEADRMIFDYILRDGVVERSNAIALMRSVGLDV